MIEITHECLKKRKMATLHKNRESRDSQTAWGNTNQSHIPEIQNKIYTKYIYVNFFKVQSKDLNKILNAGGPTNEQFILLKWV